MKISDEEYHSIRADIEHQGVRGLLIINGGAAVSLLAFLQAIWDKDSELAKITIYGILFFTIGVFSAASINLFRYHTSLAAQQKKRKKHRIYFNLSYLFRYLALFMFGTGIFVIITGALRILNS